VQAETHIRPGTPAQRSWNRQLRVRDRRLRRRRRVQLARGRVQDFVQAEDFRPHTLSASGSTAMGAGRRPHLQIERARERHAPATPGAAQRAPVALRRQRAVRTDGDAQRCFGCVADVRAVGQPRRADRVPEARRRKSGVAGLRPSQAAARDAFGAGARFEGGFELAEGRQHRRRLAVRRMAA